MSSHAPVTSRREFLIAAGLGSLALTSVGLAAQGVPPAVAETPASRKRAIRVAHLTDFHIQPERKADFGVGACFKHLASLPEKPELILTGGDTVMDSFDADEARTRLQWELWQKVHKAECGIPTFSAIGNHDIWGWNKKKSGTNGSEARYGKKWVLEMFGRDKPWTSFDRAGWHFVLLDSVQQDGEGYLAYLDDEQYAWLESDLKATKPETPVLILSHIPILSIAGLASSERTKQRKWELSGALMHLDAFKLKNLFARHRNVKLCLSGHLHLVDRCDYQGVTYLCNGAVCGAWWKGPNQECEPGYAVLDLFTDGTFENRYIPYGWKAQV